MDATIPNLRFSQEMQESDISSADKINELKSLGEWWLHSKKDG